MKTAIVKYSDLKDGDRVYESGYLMEVSNLHEAELYNGRKAIRFTGTCVEKCAISNTAYNGAIYGAYGFVQAEKAI